MAHPPRLASVVLAAALALMLGCGGAPPAAPAPPPAAPEAARDLGPAPEARALDALDRLMASCQGAGCPLVLPPGARAETVVVTPAAASGDGEEAAAPRVEVRLSEAVGTLVWRRGEVTAFEARVQEAVREAIPGAEVHTAVLGGAAPVPLAQLASAEPVPPRPLPPGAAPLVRRLDAPHAPEAGLQGRHLAVWPSHGWYYEPDLDRWEWQRARVFTTVEDVLPYAFMHRHLTPMLERAGATVLWPRERDVQERQAVVDNDGRDEGRYAERGRWRTGGTGFAHRPPYRGTVNPFTLGTAREARTTPEASGEVIWAPEIPETGDYAVYVSYRAAPDHTEDARYTVRHAGGAARFAVNQTMGGGTWVYLGTFTFAAGAAPEAASVTLSTASATPGRTVSADGVRFGGGMGSVERGGATSGRPRWLEAARYYEQFAGFPAETVYNVSGELDDYKDDYQSRGEWANYLRGAPYGPTGDRNAPGLGVPVDLALAFHTDAGVTDDGTVIGTLLIVNTEGMDETGVFPDGSPRAANRTLAGIARREITGDLRALWKDDWTFRDIWDRGYSEATRPNVPSLLLELLSHQNAEDMRYALDPRFRRDASRALYKSIGRFLAQQSGRPFVPQPLAPTHLVAELEGGAVRVRWRPQMDPLEPSAVPTRYVVYQRREAVPAPGARGRSARGRVAGWDGGTPVDGTETALRAPEAGGILSVRVAAVNAGGESEWSEALAVGVGREGGPPVVVVSGFDRTAPPAYVAQGGRVGFDRALDEGVPDGLDVLTVGAQHEFDPREPWVDDDQPGHGASDADLETTVFAGNTRDFVAVHGRAIVAGGRSFVSASDEAVMDADVNLARYPTAVLAMGEERRTPWPSGTRAPAFRVWPAPFRRALRGYAGAGGRILASGAYLGTDARGDAEAEAFLADVLGVRWRTGDAAVTGALVASGAALLPDGTALSYTTDYRRDRYRVEAPDGLVPASPLGRVALRYAENSISAGVVAPGAVTFGFPFESVTDPEARQRLMAAALAALGANPPRPAEPPGADR